MQAYFSTKEGAVQYAEDFLRNLKQVSQLTIVIKRGKSGVYFVSCATSTVWEDTGKST